jgi:hypothetical protein
MKRGNFSRTTILDFLCLSLGDGAGNFIHLVSGLSHLVGLRFDFYDNKNKRI